MTGSELCLQVLLNKVSLSESEDFVEMWSVCGIGRFIVNFLNLIFILYRRLLIYSVVLVSAVRKVIQLPILFQILFLYQVMTKY